MSPSVSHDRPIHVMPIVGTRPEAVKMAPLINLLKSQPQNFKVTVTVTGQHREMLDQVMRDAFGVYPYDFDLEIMTQGQTLTQITTRALAGLEPILVQEKPDIVLAQGDTTTVLAASLAASYQQIAFGHVEAGLRTDNKFNPFPEELNRRLTTQITDLHFAPTQQSVENLRSEGVPDEAIYLTGNTVIDALLQVAGKSEKQSSDLRTILVTTHRRENLGEPLQNIALALHDILEKFEDTQIVLPMHKNPAVREVLQRILGNHPRVSLIEPLDYLPFVRAMENAHLILTDSGGVQEEAPSLGIPVLVLRRTTERPEGVSAGTAALIGTERSDIVNAASQLLSEETAYQTMSQSVNPYGDGKAGERIAQAILHWAGRGERPGDFAV